MPTVALIHVMQNWNAFWPLFVASRSAAGAFLWSNARECTAACVNPLHTGLVHINRNALTSANCLQPFLRQLQDLIKEGKNYDEAFQQACTQVSMQCTHCELVQGQLMLPMEWQEVQHNFRYLQCKPVAPELDPANSNPDTWLAPGIICARTAGGGLADFHAPIGGGVLTVKLCLEHATAASFY